jgi:Ca2+-transporting ATPase
MSIIRRRRRRLAAARTGGSKVKVVASEVVPTDREPTWHALPSEQVAKRLATGERGLSQAEAAKRLARYGPNALREAPPPSNLLILLHQFQSPLIAILVVAAVVTTLLGEYLDAGAIAAVLLLNALIGFVQERQAERSVRSLLRLVAPRARVVRDGHEREIESRQIVPGDVVALETGVRVAADVRLAAATALLVDESLLTGESLPVAKRAASLAEQTELTDRTNMTYAGTVVAGGRGWGYVVATGDATALGAIATQVHAEARAQPPLQRRLARFARLIGVAAVGSALIAFAVGLARGESASDMFVVAVALAVSAVPEGLPVAFTIALAVGVRRMAYHRALIRRLAAVETLGSASVIGSDKTGTLTENRMTVQRLWAGGRFAAVEDGAPWGTIAFDAEAADLPEAQRPLFLTLLTGILTNEAEIAESDGRIEITGDPTEAALLTAAEEMGLDPEAARDAWPIVAEIPFEPERQYSATVRERNGLHQVFVKGAPERVLAMCSDMLGEAGLGPLDAERIGQAAQEMASGALRVLAMAYRPLPRRLDAPDDVEAPRGLTFLGLQGMMDPPRAGVREAIAICRDAGIRVVMVTGDHAQTAQAIGRDLGIAGEDAPPLTGAQVARLDDEALRAATRRTAIYARVAPEHKLRVVRALQADGEVVAVTGDGVNDAPALKAADIGVAMGRSGTDVAREAADMVLADDNFVSIAAAVEEGRITFDNVRKVTFFLLSANAAEVLTILVALALEWPLPLLAVQILWLNLVTDSLQVTALAFEPGEPGVLRRRPRPPREGILSRLLWERAGLSALVMGIGTLALYRWELDSTGSEAVARTVALTVLVIFQVFQVGNARSEDRSLLRTSPWSNRFLVLATAAAVAIHVAALYLPPTQYVLRVEPIGLDAWARVVLMASSIVVAVELDKAIHRRRTRLPLGLNRGG